MTAVVRPAVEADVTSIATICATAYRETYRELLPQGYIDRSVVAFYDPDRVAEEIRPAPPEWFGYQVIEEGGRVLGAAGGGMLGNGRGELSRVYLESAARGRGLGTALLESVSAQISAAGGTEMWVSVFLGDRAGIGFYRARGFEPRDTVRAALSRIDDHIVSLRMCRTLS